MVSLDRQAAHRTKVTKGPGSRAAGLAMAFKLIESAQARRRAINVPHLCSRRGLTVVVALQSGPDLVGLSALNLEAAMMPSRSTHPVPGESTMDPARRRRSARWCAAACEHFPAGRRRG
jgi:hypothetical protein